MKILLVGSGGREHALGWKLKQSPNVAELISAPGNPGLAKLGRCVAIKADDAAELAALAAREQVDLVVVGPENALAAGLTDRLEQIGIPVFGPTKAAAELESSKAFTKDFLKRHDIPCAHSETFDDAVRAKAYLADREPPYVIKADGLAAGKGVIVAQSRREADEAIDQILFLKKFGAAGQRILIEDFLEGEEASFFALCDGETAVAFGNAQDHKRAFDGDKGPNTGGMGAYSPAPVFSQSVQDEVMEKVVLPTVRGMAAEGRPFRGVLFCGVMITPTGPRIFEFNVRFGDPETQVLMMRLKSDLAETLLAIATGKLSELAPLAFDTRPAITIVAAANGYPDEPLAGSVIRGVADAEQLDDVMIFHAGTRQDEDGALRAAGGRVLNITATGADLRAAITRAYEAASLIDWPGGFWRSDIGWRALSRENLARD